MEREALHNPELKDIWKRRNQCMHLQRKVYEFQTVLSGKWNHAGKHSAGVDLTESMLVRLIVKKY